MKRIAKKLMTENRLSAADFGAESIENHKRRRALPPFSGALDPGSRLFFDRILSVRKIREFIFITNAKARTRQS
ncbi:MAG TPA: hypothetical protein VL404_06830 [Candidatus Eisenbacteria bacterium]|nr:hypothetical protein [Candidatus Eisenbacteria bacterium]